MSAESSSVAADIRELLASLSEASAARPGSGAIPIPVARENHEDSVRQFSPLESRDPVESVTTVDVSVRSGDLRVVVYEPTKAPAAVLVWIHGGGWVTGSTDTADVMARAFSARCGIRVVAVSYGLAPESPWPTAVDDVRDATEWVLTQTAHDGSSLPVLIGGDSAGGNLAAVVALELGAERLAGQVLVYPVIAVDEDQFAYPSRVDNAVGYYVEWADVAWAIDQYVGVSDRTSERVSPMRSSRRDSVPSAVIAVAGLDPLRDEGVAYARWIEHHGGVSHLLEFPTLVHGAFDMIGRSPSANRAMKEIAEAVNRGLIR